MFALVRLGQTPASVSLKGDPDLAVGLRDRSAGIMPGHHLTKRPWNTVTLDGSVPGEKALELIGQYCDLLVARLTTTQRDRLITKPPSAAARSADMPMIGY